MYVDTSCSDLHPSPVAHMQRAQGRARISFRQRLGATRLDTLFQEGCAKLRLPKCLPGEAPQAVLINTAGGLTGGDRLTTGVELGPNSRAIMTTQACERIYRSTGDDAVVSTTLRLGKGARLAWLPQETILFNDARLTRTLDVDLAGDAELLAVEAVLFGRAAMGEQVVRGKLHDRWRIRRDGRLLFADDLRFDGAIAGRINRAAVLDGRGAVATVLLAGSEPERLLDDARGLIGDCGGASAWAGKLVVRLAAESGLALRRSLEPLLTLLLNGQALPKVWQL